MFGFKKRVSNLTAPIRAYLMMLHFPREERSRAMATWEVLSYNPLVRGEWNLLLAHLRDEQLRGAFKPMASRPVVPTSDIFN